MFSFAVSGLYLLLVIVVWDYAASLNYACLLALVCVWWFVGFVWFLVWFITTFGLLLVVLFDVCGCVLDVVVVCTCGIVDCVVSWMLDYDCLHLCNSVVRFFLYFWLVIYEVVGVLVLDFCLFIVWVVCLLFAGWFYIVEWLRPVLFLYGLLVFVIVVCFAWFCLLVFFWVVDGAGGMFDWL